MPSCKNCTKDFQITDQDRAFYARIKVPDPTHCPDCRMQRRLSFRNERALYARPCDLCKKPGVSIYSSSKPYAIYCTQCYWSDQWTAKSYGRDWNPLVSFIDQFRELQLAVPRIALLSMANENSEYTNNAEYNKNCYLIFAARHNENCYYSKLLWDSKDTIDAAYVFNTQLSYEAIDCRDCYHCMWSQQCTNSHDLLFCYNCRGSSDCLLSTNLTNKQYCIRNQQYTKEEYLKKRDEVLATYASVRAACEELERIKSNSIVKYRVEIKSENATGNYLYNARESRQCFDVSDVLQSAFLGDAIEVKDTYDGNNVYEKIELSHELMGCVHLYDCHFGNYTFESTRCQYTDSCVNGCEDLFGCVGVRKAQYCILNKQYSKEEYLALREKIIASMKADESYGEYFPARISPFGYNETVAQEYFPMTKDQVLAKGWKWEDQAVGKYGGETMKAADLPERIEDVKDDILQATIACGACGRQYRVIKQELAFYRTHHIPLPHKCFECRHQDRIRSRNPRRLWHRQCVCTEQTHSHHQTGKCPNEFETSYAPERSEKVFCEACYQLAVL